ncbi:hypothetical protein, partial [Bradyrhizobium sp. CW11]|uniref:hypothetical protein n=1 Tax=Bradyrhizobium sp. CW11 TaxID=2782684 RepID=UPI001FF8BFC8
YHRPAALQLPQNRRCLNGSDAALDTKAIRQKRERHRAEKIALTIHEHSGAAATGILAFQARPSLFEFVAADCGAGVLATLREDEEFAELDDHGLAMHAALQENVSRYDRFTME